MFEQINLDLSADDIALVIKKGAPALFDMYSFNGESYTPFISAATFEDNDSDEDEKKVEKVDAVEEEEEEVEEIDDDDDDGIGGSYSSSDDNTSTPVKSKKAPEVIIFNILFYLLYLVLFY